MEVIHRSFCKFVLGLPTSAANLACYGELGRPPLILRRKLQALKYWIRISTNWDISPLVYDAYMLARDTPLNWAISIKDVLDSTGFSEVWYCTVL